MINTICRMVILFFIYACIGWCMEVTLKFIQYRRFINRGFLIGPYCPIYGWGAVAVTVLVGGMIGREGTISEIFWAGYVLCGVLEYATSWYMEKRFHARWWDYSNKPMNLHGRIWVGNLLLFGAGSVLIICWLDPLFFSIIDKLNPFWLHSFAIAIVLLMLADHIASDVLMRIVRKEIDAQEGDNTEEISRRVHDLLKDHNLLLRRIEQAYPELRSEPHWMTLQLRQARTNEKNTRRKLETMLKENNGKNLEAANGSEWQERMKAAIDAHCKAQMELREMEKKFSPNHNAKME
jgi:uncharacterized membrane protein